ncbi:MAG TPA: glycosyltransferase [Thermoanaerobaculia bacterium]|nr:glycosyltransferase [Thermoanaerobaculia bacterium]
MSVSVVIPTYNRAATVGRAIDSVLAQGVACEIVVVDDGSTDDTASRLAAYGDRIRVVTQPNGGVAAARNAGLRVATGDVIAFLDSDDEWLPGKLARQLSLLESDPRVALVGGNAEYVDAKGRVEMVGSASSIGVPPEQVVAQLLLENFVVTSSVIVRRNAIDEFDPPFLGDFTPSEDWILWLRIAGRHPIAITRDVVTRYHIMSDSIARTAPPTRFRRAYAGVYLLEKIDPVLRPMIAKRHRLIRIRANFWTALAYYENRDYWRARVLMLRAIAAGPWLVKWKTAIPILFLPKSVRDAVKRRVA